MNDIPPKHELRRAGFSEDLTQAYLHHLASGSTTSSPQEIDLLLEARLAEREVDGSVRIFPPETALGQRADELEHQARALRDVGPRLESIYRAAIETPTPTVQFLRTADALVAAFNQIQLEARDTIRALECDPQRRAYSVEPVPAQVEAIAAGVRYQVVYSADMLEHDILRQTIYNAIALGEEARTLPHVPMRIFLADRDAALVVKVLPAPHAESCLAGPACRWTRCTASSRRCGIWPSRCTRCGAAGPRRRRRRWCCVGWPAG